MTSMDRSPGPASAVAVMMIALVGSWACVPQPPMDDDTAVVRVVSYNIRHGRGMDDAVDLERTARVLETFRPDLVGLQEVDREAERSGGVDQATELGRLLGMTPTFGAFMPYQGGHYGMAILSRMPVIRSWAIELPEGNEPRIALAAQIAQLSGDTLVAVNVHFDWVDDDAYRFAQASALVAVLDTLSHPWILLGDLNDEPGSRTLALFQERAMEARKPRDDRFTFSTDDPRKEIDFVFAAPPERWRLHEAYVAREAMASDHRPVVAVWAWGEAGGK